MGGLLIFFTLACLYFGCWELTKHLGCDAGARSPMPFVIAADGTKLQPVNKNEALLSPCRYYYLWFFGRKVEIWRT